MTKLAFKQALSAGAMQAAAWVTMLKLLGITPNVWVALGAYFCLCLIIRIESGRGFND